MQDERGGGLDRFAMPLYGVAEAAHCLDVPKRRPRLPGAVGPGLLTLAWYALSVPHEQH